MTYLTIRATVRDGKVELLDHVALPEDATLLVTVMEDLPLPAYTLGDHLMLSLADILAGRVTEAVDEQQLSDHLDHIFNDM